MVIFSHHFSTFQLLTAVICVARAVGSTSLKKQQKIEVDAMNQLIHEAKAMGNSFFGILGGEPFMHAEILDIFSNHPDCYFQAFTNGHFITDEVARELRRLGNVTPLISIEGNEIISDERRGGPGNVYSQSMTGLENCLRHKLLTGVCTSLCQTNFDDLLNEAWLDRLIEMGVFLRLVPCISRCRSRSKRPVGTDSGTATRSAPICCRNENQKTDCHYRCLL